MSELERFIIILSKRLNDNAYWENGPFGRAELATYMCEAIIEIRQEIEEAELAK